MSGWRQQAALPSDNHRPWGWGTLTGPLLTSDGLWAPGRPPLSTWQPLPPFSLRCLQNLRIALLTPPKAPLYPAPTESWPSPPSLPSSPVLEGNAMQRQSSSSDTDYLCDPGQVASPLWANFSSVTWRHWFQVSSKRFHFEMSWSC